MKLIRFGEPGKEKPGVVLEDGSRIDVSAAVSDYDEKFFEGGGLKILASWLRTNAGSAPKVAPSTRLGSAIARPSKIVCIGLNYRDHAIETKSEEPKQPVIFFKASSSLVGPNDNLVIPRGATKVDFEVELAIVIGKRASYVPKEKAREYVAGFVLHNDYSERAFQIEMGGQWVKGKSADTFAPVGPFLATTDEIPNPGNLKMWLKVNGKIRQNSSTSNMIFDVDTIVSYVSQFMSLLPGDLITTGTPAGVAMGGNPPAFLQAGDIVNLGVEGLGESQQHIVAYDGRQS